MEHLGLGYYGPGLVPGEDCIVQGGYQTAVRFYSRSNESATLFTVCGKALSRPSEAKESALYHALIHIDEVLGYNIVDFNYIKYLRLRASANP